jgi:Protein of unknown function (DUF2905)
MGRLLIVLGIILVLVGVVVSLGPKIPWLGHLPGDIFIKGERVSFYFPLTTCVLLSLILSLVLYLFRR